MVTKRCSKCKAEKELAEFYKDRSTCDGLTCQCKSCAKTKSVLWRLKNPEKAKAHSIAWPIVNRERANATKVAWARKNPDKTRGSKRTYSRAHPDKDTAKNAVRRARKLCATPKWADLDLIAATYTMARAITDLTGIKYTVDHIVPLQAKLVCGLHVGCNLQLLTKSQNSIKSNCHWPGMP